MDKENRKAKWKNSLEKFCNDTTLHGFKEMYYTTSICVRLTWILLMFSALGISVYQIAKAVVQYQDHPTTTLIQPLEGSPRYLPVQICYLHWIYWVDWEKGFKLGFSKESILFGLSYMTEIYSSTQFDVKDAKGHFEKVMQKKSFQTLEDFYFAISKDTPPGFTSIEGLGNFSKNFHEYWSNELCYLATPKSLVSEYLTSINRQTVSMVYNGNYTRSRKYVTLSEYSRYMFAFLDSQVKDVDLEAHILPPAVAVDGRFDDVLVSLDIYVYLIKVQIQVQQWQTSAQKPCKENTYQLKSTSDCWQMCQVRNDIRKTIEGCITFQQAVTLHNESFAPMCENSVIFFDEGNTTVPEVAYNAMNVASIQNAKNESMHNQEDCAKTCLLSCEEWRFDYHIDTKTFLSESLQNRFTWVKVAYPAPSSILVMSEIDSQTWETLIGNIGGLMGLWLGASLISIIQMMFLCCCHHEQEEKKTTVSVDMQNKQPVTTVTKTKTVRNVW